MKESPQGYTCKVKYFLKNTSDTEAEAIKNKRKKTCAAVFVFTQAELPLRLNRWLGS